MLILSSCGHSSSETSYDNVYDNGNMNEYKYKGGTYLYHEEDGELKQEAEGDVYTQNGNVYVEFYDEICPVYVNNNGNGKPSYIIYKGIKLYCDI